MKSGSKLEAGKEKEPIPKQNRINAKMPKATKSSRSYDNRTLKLLWGRAAGRCAMPDCRIELFVTEPGYDPVWNIGEMGHIVASSDDGPRGSASLERDLRDTYDNLVLLCRNCHGKIDGLKEAFPVDRLRDIKSNHEAWVRTALPERGASSIRWRVVKLQGNFPFDPSTTSEALSPDQEYEDELVLRVSATEESWAEIQNRLRTTVEGYLGSGDAIATRVAVFPLAPVSSCVYLGFLLTNRVNVRAFQYHRDARTWVWPTGKETYTSPSFIESEPSDSTAAALFFVFELSAPIDMATTREALGGPQAVYRCSVPNTSTSWLQSKAQLDELARKAREMFEIAAIKYPRSSQWHVFYAGPAPGAVIVGQQLNPTMIPPVRLYEYQRPAHIPSILISGKDSALTRWSTGL